MLYTNRDDAAVSENADWLDYFWEQVGGIGECLLETGSESEDEAEPTEDLERIIVRFRNASRKELREREEAKLHKA